MLKLKFLYGYQRVSSLNTNQRLIHRTTLHAIFTVEQLLLFVGGPEGCGNVYLLSAVVSDVAASSWTKNPTLSTQTCFLRSRNSLTWSTISSLDRSAFNLVDLSLQELKQNLLPFGCMSVIFGGDFRQTLQVNN
ncbi:hypothetical protein VP01_2511g1 [Puccinia sorghi]|uniref:ATP-dependent DNA helicase n=1 Tax=Puccinia sorghi TaxID=27349 RepID=A0A0L6V5G8_9BASI|nr:hypothetical protein VP01_2511g1 [Puccinia sorghi]